MGYVFALRLAEACPACVVAGGYLCLGLSKKVSERHDGTACVACEREEVPIAGNDPFRLSGHCTFKNAVVWLVS